MKTVWNNHVWIKRVAAEKEKCLLIVSAIGGMLLAIAIVYGAFTKRIVRNYWQVAFYHFYILELAC